MTNTLADRKANLHVATTLVPFADTLKNFKGYKKAGSQKLDIPAKMEQTERLYTTRSRSVNHQDGGGDRGERAFIKVLTTNTKRSLDRKSSESHGISNPTSLNDGALKDAITGKGYASFLLTDVNCTLEEKLQVVEAFGDAEVSYYFGRQPIMFNFGGVLIDSVDNNWFVEFIEMYSHVMRGTELARNYELLQIVLPNMAIIGTITRMSWSQNATRDVDIPFQFSFMAKQITPIKTLTPNKPITDDHVIDWKKSTTFLSQSHINSVKLSSVKDKVDNLTSVIKNPLSSLKDYSTSLSNFSLGGVATAMIPHGAFHSNPSLSNIGSATSSLSGLFAGINSNLNGVRASLFSPVYGVLSSLTKLIKKVGGDLSQVFNAFTNPVRNILRDVRNISSQAIGVVNMVNSSIHNLTGQVNALDRDIQTTLLSLKKTAGVITSAPKTISSSLRELFNAGKLPMTTSFMKTRGRSNTISSGKLNNPKLALLNSGKRHTPELGAKL